jgi:hypothetical protein
VKREPIPELPDLPARRSASLLASDAAELARIRAMTMIERIALALELGRRAAAVEAAMAPSPKPARQKDTEP